MKWEKESSGVAKAGLATGVVGATLGAINLMGNGAGLVGSVLGRTNGCGVVAQGCGGCNEDHLVDRFTLEQQSEIERLRTEVALRDANHYNDQKSLELYQYIDQQVAMIHQQLGAQAVQNQKTADSFQMVSERMACMKNDFCNQLSRERSERKCADNQIVNYVNATFYPKMVADVTTGSTTTAQTLYNPLPAETCDCDPCGC